MDFAVLALAAISGYCGTGWPIRFPIPPGGGPVPPDGDWPPNCPVCGPIVGAVAGVVTVFALGPQFGDTGVFQTVALGFLGGSFLAHLIGGVRFMVTRG